MGADAIYDIKLKTNTKQNINTRIVGGEVMNRSFIVHILRGRETHDRSLGPSKLPRPAEK